MDEEDNTEKIEEETKSVEEAIKQGMTKASENTSVQSQEDTISQFSSIDRRRFQNIEHRRQAVKEQVSRLKAKKIEDGFYKWNEEFLELNYCLGTKVYVTDEKPYPTTQEILCDTMADGDEERYVREVIPWFGRVFLTFPGSNTLEILHPLEFVRLQAACSHLWWTQFQFLP